MGAWGHGAFDNDDACDWETILEADGKDAIESALFGINLRDLSDDTDCSAAIAACEVVAAANGYPMRQFNTVAGTASEWIKELQYRPTKRVVTRAQKIATAVQTDSGLAELWSESGDLASWKRSISGLIKRLEKSPKPPKIAKTNASPAKKKVNAAKKRAASKKPPAATSDAITVRRAKQIVKKKLDGSVSELAKKDIEVYIEATRKLANRDAEELATLEDVTRLNLDFVKVAPEKAAAVERMLRGWTSLNRINAGTSKGLASMICRLAPDLPQLSQLELSDTEVTDKDIRTLSASSSLQTLDLGRTQVTAKSLDYLARFPSLQRVSLYKCPRISIPAVNKLLDATATRLRANYYPSAKQLGIKPLTDAQKNAFDNHNERVRKLIDDDWSYVWVNLHYGDLAFGQFLDEERLQVIADGCKVDSLQIGVNQSRVRDEYADGLRLILNAWPGIRYLDVTKATTLDDSFADVFGQFKKLKSLSLQDVNVTDKTVQKITKLTSLAHLGLVRTQITKKSLAKIAVLPQLRWLEISPGNDIKTQDLLRLRKKMPDTCYVEIVGQ